MKDVHKRELYIICESSARERIGDVSSRHLFEQRLNDGWRVETAINVGNYVHYIIVND